MAINEDDVDELVRIVNAGAYEAMCGCDDGYIVSWKIAKELAEVLKTNDPSFDSEAFLDRCYPWSTDRYRYDDELYT